MKTIAIVFLFLISILSVPAYTFAQVPLSVSVKTASYAIPARKYAEVIVNVEGSGTFTIDGSVALRSTQNNVLTSANNMYRIGGTPTTAASATAQGQVHMGSVPVGATSSSIVPVYANETDQKTIATTFRLPAGTVINGSGTWRATVILYER